MFERFTRDARDVVVRAQEEARDLRADRIEPLHLLVAVAAVDGPGRAALAAAGVDAERLRPAAAGAAGDPLDAQALAALGVDLDSVRTVAEEVFGPGALDPAPSGGHLPFADGSKRALEESLRYVLDRRPRRRRRAIDSACVLVGVLAVDDPVVERVLRSLGADAADVRDRAREQPGAA
ncbi:Clp protease [Geodermatophilus sp. YIM 151500]|uniref:Clp protease N-terminal domain-containing protein n=1 Tax=Geodermatophilus sp. YIM 151500 TaxID=2984531 RepID=UPI0021E3D2AB|nr:Clp protease N-terminal domain-containing protein [Geodermatophilus sp. YIM 151500]MCV2491650.1 Clp protease [Geodermatophilus sp. YIM 151500]